MLFPEVFENSTETAEKASRGTRIKNCSNKQRQRHLVAACKNRNLKNGNFYDKPDLSNILYDDEEKLLFCNGMGPVLFEQLGSVRKGGLGRKSILSRMRPLSELQYEEIHVEYRLSEYRKMLLVYHPLTFFVDFLRGICDDPKYSSESTSERAPVAGPNTTLLVCDNQRVVEQRHIEGYLKAINNSQFDYCHPCDIRYDHVLKIETIDHDTDLFSLQTNDSNLSSMLGDLAKTMNHILPGLKTIEAVIQQANVDTLSETLESLWQSVDLTLFGYTLGNKHGNLCQILGPDNNTCC